MSKIEDIIKLGSCFEGNYISTAWIKKTLFINMIEEKELKGRDFDEVVEIYNKYYVTIPIKKEGFDKIEKVTYYDDDVEMVITFNSKRNSDVAKSSINYKDYNNLVRREKILKIKNNVS